MRPLQLPDGEPACAGGVAAVVADALLRELEGMGSVKDSTLAESALALAAMLDDPGTADTARTGAARELRETLGVLRAAAGDSGVDGMTEFERRARDRDALKAAAQ